jgi:hypothetical protein
MQLLNCLVLIAVDQLLSMQIYRILTRRYPIL